MRYAGKLPPNIPHKWVNTFETLTYGALASETIRQRNTCCSTATAVLIPPSAFPHDMSSITPTFNKRAHRFQTNIPPFRNKRRRTPPTATPPTTLPHERHTTGPQGSRAAARGHHRWQLYLARLRGVRLDARLLGRPISVPPRLCGTSISISISGSSRGGDNSSSIVSSCYRGAWRGLGLGPRGASRCRRLPRGVPVQPGLGNADRCDGEAKGVRAGEKQAYFQGGAGVREGYGLGRFSWEDCALVCLVWSWFLAHPPLNYGGDRSI